MKISYSLIIAFFLWLMSIFCSGSVKWCAAGKDAAQPETTASAVEQSIETAAATQPAVIPMDPAPAATEPAVQPAWPVPPATEPPAPAEPVPPQTEPLPTEPVEESTAAPADENPDTFLPEILDEEDQETVNYEDPEYQEMEGQDTLLPEI